MNAVGNDLYDASYLARTDKRFEARGIPGDLPLFDPVAYQNGFSPQSPESDRGSVLMSVWKFQEHITRNSSLFTQSPVSIQVARAVAQYKTACSAQGVSTGQDYCYLYSLEYKGWHHFFRDETTGTLLDLATAGQFQSGAWVLCLDGRRVLTHICEENRPGEKTEGYLGLSLEALLPHIDHDIPLFLSGEPFQVIEALGEGFESVVFKVRHCLSGSFRALKLGKLALGRNYHTLQVLLNDIKQSGISLPKYISYDESLNSILMEYKEGERFSNVIEQMEQQKKTPREVFQIYAMCLSQLIALQATLHVYHGDAHEENWIFEEGKNPVLIDFRHSLTVPFTSPIYRDRDVFAMLGILYRLIYGKHPANRREMKQAIMQQRIYQAEHADEFPSFDCGNRYDQLLHQFLRRSVYRPQHVTLHDIARVVELYRSGFQSSRGHKVHSSSRQYAQR